MKIPAIQESDDDHQLVALAAAGHDRAFELLVERHQDAIVRFLARLGAGSDAQDLAQDTFVRFYRHLGTYRPGAKFTTYLFTIARHAWIDHNRRRTRESLAATPTDHELEIEQMLAPTGEPDGLQLDTAEALARLSPKLREVLILRIMEGFTNEEAAEILGVPAGTVKSRLHLGLRELRHHLEVYVYDRR